MLQRWSAAVPPERIHVLVLDPTAPTDDVWNRFAGIVGFDPTSCDLSGSFPNSSMGVAEAETLRRVNSRLQGFTKAFDKGVYIRTFLADERLVPRRGDKFWPKPDQIEECRQRAQDAVACLTEGSFDVVGRLEHLLVPETLEERRVPSSVTDAEVAEVAVDLVAVMLGDVRRLRRRDRADEDGGEPWLRSIVRRWRRRRGGLTRCVSGSGGSPGEPVPEPGGRAGVLRLARGRLDRVERTLGLLPHLRQARLELVLRVLGEAAADVLALGRVAGLQQPQLGQGLDVVARGDLVDPPQVLRGQLRTQVLLHQGAQRIGRDAPVGPVQGSAGRGQRDPLARELLTGDRVVVQQPQTRVGEGVHDASGVVDGVVQGERGGPRPGERLTCP